jgi:hypothetical protein
MISRSTRCRLSLPTQASHLSTQIRALLTRTGARRCHGIYAALYALSRYGRCSLVACIGIPLVPSQPFARSIVDCGEAMADPLLRHDVRPGYMIMDMVCKISIRHSVHVIISVYRICLLKAGC